MSDDALIIVKHKNSQRPSSHWSNSNSILMSEDYFKTSKVLLSGGNQFALTTDYMYAGRMDRDGNKKLVMANRKDKFATFYYTSQFKKGEKNLDFTILERQSGAVFVYVRDDEHNFRGNVYMSDAHGKAFSLSMKNAI